MLLLDFLRLVSLRLCGRIVPICGLGLVSDGFAAFVCGCVWFWAGLCWSRFFSGGEATSKTNVDSAVPHRFLARVFRILNLVGFACSRIPKTGKCYFPEKCRWGQPRKHMEGFVNERITDFIKSSNTDGGLN